jgi:hypothetical protein
MTISEDKRIANADRAIDHEREMFKVNDARIVTVETQATAIVAAAIAVAAFFLAAVVKEAPRPPTVQIVVVVALGGVAAMAALIARADNRRVMGSEGQAREEAVINADNAVRAVVFPASADPVALRLLYAKTWRMRTRSTSHRLKIKRRWVQGASIALAAEFIVGALVAST